MGRAFEVRKAAMAKTSAQKSRIYSKNSSLILQAIKKGGNDINANIELKRALENAKKNQVPNEIINRALEKGKNRDQISLTSAIYEGFGPQNSTLMIEVLTDNTNRVISFIKASFKKIDSSKLAGQGAVSFNYLHCGVISVKDISEEELFEKLFANEISFIDIESEDNVSSIYVDSNNFYKSLKAIEEIIDSSKILESELIYKANELVKIVDPIEKEQFIKLLGMLEEIEEVQNIFHNVLLE